MKKRTIALIGVLTLGLLGGQAAFAQANEYHGADSVFTKNGIVIVWAIEKRGGDTSPLVYLRIACTPEAAPAFRYYTLLAVDPFTSSTRPLAVGQPLAELNTQTAEMSDFQSYSSRRILFFATEDDLRSNNPQMVVFYQGVPDTSPEFVEKAKLESYLAETVKRMVNR